MGYNGNLNFKKMEFDVEKTVSYWLESAKYDLDVADANVSDWKISLCFIYGVFGDRKTTQGFGS